MKRIFDKLVYSDDGAVAVDWIVLTAGVIAMFVVVFQAFNKEVTVFASEKIVGALEVISAYLF
ncbi:MAG: hypothetical protein P8X69_03755 [Maritimibacter sp.]|jgi:hypothetical protein